MEADDASENPAAQEPSEDPTPVGSSTGFGFFGLFLLIALLFSQVFIAGDSVFGAWFAPIQALFRQQGSA
ncbi:hypothetical protein [Corynebacterium kozikiae]|uniref:hypothetical protein n=1 Tax=Corynebacterium kozikiae TaxID=2968469 RepID=UPI00211D06B9|nr:hypothetical protein [Corynebacterium sp. 76QC2CO]MCQ9342766.1 hypothetical protein [Corynebacterium sp. 76QC2CO]